MPALAVNPLIHNLIALCLRDVIDGRKRLFKGFVLATMMVLGLGSCGMEKDRSYLLATGTEGGTFFPAGATLATLVTTRLQSTHQIVMATIGSPGSEENARLLQKDQAQFAFMSAPIAHFSWTGQDPFEADGPYTGLRMVAALWPDVEHFVIRRGYAQTGTIEDMRGLKGKKVSLGLKGSGTLRSGRFLLGNLGIDVDRDFDLILHTSFDENTRALLHGQIEALSLEAGVPASAITLVKTFAGDEAVILEFTDAQLERADGGIGLWSRYVIEAGTYPNQDRDINTIATPTILAVRADVDAEAVYQITRTIFENLESLRVIHKAFLETRLDRALAGLPVPLHPGASRYYREAGLAVPAEHEH